MTQTQSDRLKDVQRQYAEMEHHTATLQQAQQAAEQAAWVAERQLPVADRQVPGRISRAAAGPRGVAVRAALHPERGGDRGGGRRAGGGVGD